MRQYSKGTWTPVIKGRKKFVLTAPDTLPFSGQVIAVETTAPESDDNLLLMASAPAMREALGWLVDAWKAGCSIHPDSGVAKAVRDVVAHVDGQEFQNLPT